MNKTIRILILITMLALFATQVMANDQILAPDDNCPDNLTLLPANTEVYFAPYTQQGQVSNGFVEQDVLNTLHSYYMNYFQLELPVSSLLTLPPELDDLGEAPTPIVLTGNYACYTDSIIGIFREAQVNGNTAWIVEKIIIEELVMTDEVIEHFTTELLEPLEMAPEDDPQLNYLPSVSMGFDTPPVNPVLNLDVQSPDTTPVLRNARFNFWHIYNVTIVDTPDTLTAPDPLPQNYCGDYNAPSYLAVGMQAQMAGYQYARFPLSGDLMDDNPANWLELGASVMQSQYTMNFYDAMRELPIYEIAVDDFDNIFTVVDAETLFAPPVYGAPMATILSGPVCGEQKVNPPCNDNFCEATVTPNQYITWWEIEVTVHGETYQGWYPENVNRYAWWLYEEDGFFDQVANAYLLTPYGEAMTVMGEDDNCEQLPSSRFVAGMDVQPAGSAMNIRDDANGSVIGRVEASDRMSLVGEPECEEGIRWREVIFHSGSVARGWIAENDATVFYLAPYVPPTPDPIQPDTSEQQPDTSGQQPDNNNNNNPRPSTVRPTPTPQSATLVIPVSSCNPTTGRGC